MAPTPDRTARDLCHEHGYPPELCEVLEALDAAARAAFPGLESLVLSGSVATGDFVWRRGDRGVELLSDIDAQLFTDPGGARPERLAETLHELEQRHAFPLFQIDLSVNAASGLRHIPQTYQMAEVRRAGFVLSGRDVLGAFPERFDPKASRQAFLLNLWKPLLYWSSAGRGTEWDDTCYALAAARLFLDLPLLAASEAGSCIPGHRRRAAAYLETPASLRPVEGGAEAVEWALALRDGRLSRDVALEQRVSDFAFQVVEALDGLGPPPREPDAALVQRLTRWLPRRTLRRLGGELRSLLGARDRALAKPGWLFARKEALGGAALLGSLDHLCHPDGAPPAGTAALLTMLSGLPPSDDTGIRFVYAAKQAYWEGLKLLYPTSARKESGIARFLALPEEGC